MSHRSQFLCLCLISACLLQFVCADIETNEVHDNNPEPNLINGIQIYPNDRQCVLLGGLCVHSGDCLAPTTNKGLCPSSAHLGVECCYELPDIGPAPCAQHLGECMPHCNEALRRPGTDCKNGNYCCLLV